MQGLGPVNFETVTCADCAISFAVVSHFIKNRLEDHQPFYCPNGHANRYPGPSEVEKLRKALDLTKKERDRAWARERDAERELKAETTSIRPPKG